LYQWNVWSNKKWGIFLLAMSVNKAQTEEASAHTPLEAIDGHEGSTFNNTAQSQIYLTKSVVNLYSKVTKKPVKFN